MDPYCFQAQLIKKAFFHISLKWMDLHAKKPRKFLFNKPAIPIVLHPCSSFQLREVLHPSPLFFFFSFPKCLPLVSRMKVTGGFSRLHLHHQAFFTLYNQPLSPSISNLTGLSPITLYCLELQPRSLACVIGSTHSFFLNKTIISFETLVSPFIFAFSIGKHPTSE